MGIILKTAARAATVVAVAVGLFVLACLINEWAKP